MGEVFSVEYLVIDYSDKPLNFQSIHPILHIFFIRDHDLSRNESQFLRIKIQGQVQIKQTVV